MELEGNTILVTGGGSGIGLALAKRFAGLGNTVILCGRRESALQAAKAAIPSTHTIAADLSRPEGREELYRRAITEYPGLNVLVNNAGIQRYPSLLQYEPWEEASAELAINLEAPIHLSRLFVGHFMKQTRSAIINVTSGLAFVPLARAPIYSATKAAMRSFTLSLRHQLRNTPVSVVEIIPPAVQTDLGGPGLHDSGTPLEEYADSVFQQLKTGAVETTFGFSAASRNAGPQEREQLFFKMNGV